VSKGGSVLPSAEEASEYGFRIKYPSQKGFLYLDGGVGGPLFNSSTPALYSVTFVTGRVSNPHDRGGGEQITIPITVEVYAKPTSTPPIEWLSKAYSTDLTTAPKGNADTARLDAYGGHEGILSLNLDQQGPLPKAEVCRAYSGLLMCTVCFTRTDRPYVYAIGFTLLFEKNDNLVSEPDSTFIDVFTRMASTFEFMD